MSVLAHSEWGARELVGPAPQLKPEAVRPVTAIRPAAGSLKIHMADAAGVVDAPPAADDHRSPRIWTYWTPSATKYTKVAVLES